MSSCTFSNRHILNTDKFPELLKLNRCIGIRVSAPEVHHGFTPPRMVVEIERETVSINTSTTVELAVDAANWKPTARKMTVQTIEDLDKIIGELTQHRRYLKESLQHIKAA